MVPPHLQYFLRHGVASPAEHLRLIQTHISFVLLTGGLVYKFKKPVDMGFLDFRSLVGRRHYCQEELRLNRRYAPELYRDVFAVVRVGGGYRLAPEDVPDAVDYCVQMVEFPQDQILGSLAERHALPVPELTRFMGRLARLHDDSASYPELGTNEQIQRLMDENIQPPPAVQSDDLLSDDAFQAIQTFSGQFPQEHRDAFERRRRGRCIRECHGDLHLENLVLLDNRVQPFDCIEFNADFRRIDRISEVAFLVMDLERRGYADIANQCLNVYLEESGDWEALSVLPLYLCYRAFVRGRISALTARDPDCGPGVKQRMLQAARECFALASDYAKRFGGDRSEPPRLTIMHGLSGSGKSTWAATQAGREAAIHIRSDAVRKHLAGVRLLSGAAGPGEGATPDENLYTEDMTQRTYRRMNDLATVALAAGFSVILDARYSKRSQRAGALAVASACSADAEIVSCEVPADELRRRVAERRRQADNISDATVELIERQLRENEPFTPEEEPWVRRVSS